MFHRSYGKKCLPCVQSKSTLPQFKAIIPCPITTHLAKKIFPIFPIGPLQVLKGCYKVSLQPSLLQAEQPQPSAHFCGPPLDPLQQLRVFPVLRAPELDAGLQVGSQQSRGAESPLLTCWPRFFLCTQDTVGLLGCEHILSAHAQLFIPQYPQVLLSRAALSPFVSQPVLIAGVAPNQMQDLALGLVEQDLLLSRCG